MTKKEEFIVAQTKLNFYKKLEAKIAALFRSEIDVDDYAEEIDAKIHLYEDIVDNLAVELNLSDEEWEKFK